MWLENDRREEALEVLKALDVEEERLKYIRYFDGTGWMHKFEHYLGGRDGWSCLLITDGTDFDDEEDLWEYLDEDDKKEHSIIVNGKEYHFYEGD